MTSAANQPAISPPVMRVVVVAGLASLATGLIASLAVQLAGAGTFADGLMATGAVLVGVLVGVIPMAAMGPKPIFVIASAVLFGSALRAMSALGLAVAAYMGAVVEGKGFWFVFLVVAFAAMVSEVLAVMPVLQGKANKATEQ